MVGLLALALLGKLLLEALPVLAEVGFLLGCGGFIEALVAQQGKIQAVGLVGGVADGGLLVEAAFPCDQEGFTDDRALAGGVEADLLEHIAQGRAAALGDVTEVFSIAGFGGNQVVASQRPHLAGGGKVGRIADGRQVAGGE